MVKIAYLAFNEEYTAWPLLNACQKFKVGLDMAQRSIFFDEWRNCLQAHYTTFVQQEYLPQPERKTHAKDALEGVLNRVGFSEDDLHTLYVRATMRVEDVPEDFLPDMTFQTHPGECQCAACMDTVLTLNHDANGQPLPTEPTLTPELEAEGNLFPVVKRSLLFQFDDLDDEPMPLPQEVEEAGKGKRKGKKAGDAAEPKPRRQSMF